MEVTMVKEINETEHSDTEDVPLEAHNKLLNAVSQIYKKQRIDKPLRREATSQISEFNLSLKTDEYSKKLVRVKDLVNALNKGATHHEIKKKVEKLQRKSKPLPKPMEKIYADKIRRKVGYSNVRNQLNRWEAIVQRNRAAEQLKFPLKDNTEVVIKETNDFLKTFKEPTDLEKEVSAVLKTSDTAQEEKEKEEELFPLSLETIIERRKIIARMRARESYKMAKAYRQNKIKSKKYHRVLKRERIKKELKDFELLQKTNPEAALEKLEKIERARAEERITLRHRNTGKWAKSKAIRAKYDSEARAQLAEQLSKSRQLTLKLQSSIDTSSEDEQETEPEEENLQTDPSNPWKTDLEKHESEINSFLQGYKKYQIEKTNVTEGSEVKVADSKSENLYSQESTSSKTLEKDCMDVSQNVRNEKNADKTDSNGTEIRGCGDQKSESDVEDEMHHGIGMHEIHSDTKDELSNKNSNLSSSNNILVNECEKVVSTGDSPLEKDVLIKLVSSTITVAKQSLGNQSSHIEESEDSHPVLTEETCCLKTSINMKDFGTSENFSSDFEENKSSIKDKRKNDLTSLCKSNKEVEYSPKSKSIINKFENNSKEGIIHRQNQTATSSETKISGKKSLENLSSKFDKNKIKNIVRKNKRLKIKCSKVKNHSGVWAISTSEDNEERICQQKNVIIDKMFDNAENVLKETLDNHIKLLKVDLNNSFETENQNFKKPKYQADLSFKSTNKKPDSDITLVEVISEGISGGENDIKNLLNVYESGVPLKKTEQVPDVDSNKFCPAKPSKLNSGGITFFEEQEESAEEAQEESAEEAQEHIENELLNLEAAFADEDVVEEFRREKEEEVNNSKPKTIDLSLPGWGSWAGHNITQKKKTRKRKTRRLIVKFPDILRKDEKKDYVIINEELNPALKNVMVHDLPFPFTSVKDYETSIRAPIGNNWVPQSAFMKLIKPAVVTKLGAIIEPMKESALVNNKNRIRKKK